MAELMTDAQITAEAVHTSLRRVTPDTVIHTLTTYGRGQTDHVRVFVVDADQIIDVTWAVAQSLGRKVKPHAGIGYGGGGYSKGLDAAMDAARAAGFVLNQSNWREL